jgi:hypothetical protein
MCFFSSPKPPTYREPERLPAPAIPPPVVTAPPMKPGEIDVGDQKTKGLSKKKKGKSSLRIDAPMGGTNNTTSGLGIPK